MSTSLIKYKDLALKVVYYTKRRQLGSKIFFATSKFQEVLEYFEKNLKDSQTFLKSCYFLNGKQIYPSDILLYFCIVDPSLRLVEEDMFLEIEELENLDDASEPIYEKLIKPLINPFKLIILNVKDGKLQKVDFAQEKMKELELDTLNENYACCNTNEALYISCGKNFWIISNNNFIIEKREMPFFKEKHSMCYILSNNTIFIAGGSEESFYYDINCKEFITWGKMCGNQERPALIQFGDYLYSFNSFNPSGIYFEKTKLTNPAKIWEKLTPQSGDKESGFFYNRSYGVSKCSGGNILFAGGENNQLRTFIYNLKLNVLYINSSKDESIILNERNFYKIDHNFNIAIPTNIEKDHNIAIVNKNSKTLNLVEFEKIGIKTRNYLLKIDNPRNRIPGNLIIKCRYMSIKDYENFLKQKDMQTNNIKTKGGFDIYNRKDQQRKKIGENNGTNDPYKYQYRMKTALERINEGKSDEENDEEDYSKNRSSSVKKERRSLDLGLKLEDIGKFNFSTQKREEKENDKDDKNSNNENNKKNNNENIDKENADTENILDKDNKNISNNINEVKIDNPNINPNTNINVEKKQEIQKTTESIEKTNINTDNETDKLKDKNKKKITKEIKHKKINLNLDKKEERKNNEINTSEKSPTDNTKKYKKINTRANNNIQKDSNTKPNENNIKQNNNNNSSSIINNTPDKTLNIQENNNITSKSTKSNTSPLINNNSQNNPSINNNIYNPFISSAQEQNIIQKESKQDQNPIPSPNTKKIPNQNQNQNKAIKPIKSQKKSNYKTNNIKVEQNNNQEITNSNNSNISNNQVNPNIILKTNSYKAPTNLQSKGRKIINNNNGNNEIDNSKKVEILKRFEGESKNTGVLYNKIKMENTPNQRVNTEINDTKIINRNGNNNNNNSHNLSSDKIKKGNNNTGNSGNNIIIITKDGKKYILKKAAKPKKKDSNSNINDKKNEEKMSNNLNSINNNLNNMNNIDGDKNNEEITNK